MPWSETCVMDERMRFVIAASEDEAVMSEVCAEFGISRQVGYKWLARYAAEGVEGLKDRSRAPLLHGRARDEAVVEAVLALRERHPSWGPQEAAQEARRAVARRRASPGALSATGCARRD
jgi:putative transposase